MVNYHNNTDSPSIQNTGVPVCVKKECQRKSVKWNNIDSPSMRNTGVPVCVKKECQME